MTLRHSHGPTAWSTSTGLRSKNCAGRETAARGWRRCALAQEGCELIHAARILVTGAGGFIGSRVTNALVAAGAGVRALVGLPDDPVKDPDSSAESFRGAITDLALLRRVTTDMEIVVHLAGPPSVAASFDRPASYVDVHAAGTATLLDACRQTGVSRLVYISSAEIYGDAGTTPVMETHPYDPRSPYAASKVAAEQMIRAFANFAGIDATVLRPFSVYGPGQSPYALVQTIARQARSSSSIQLAGLRPVRDYVYVDDVVEAILAAVSAHLRGFQPLNIGSGVGTSVFELARAFTAETGRELPISENGSAGRPPSAEIHALIANVDRARDHLNWQPRTPLVDGVRAVLESLA